MIDVISSLDKINAFDAFSKKREKVIFDPRNKQHRESLHKFIETGSWGEIRFYAEKPYNEVPITCLIKLAKHYLDKK